MDATTLATITDIETLRRLVRDQIGVIAEQNDVITAQNTTIADRDRTLVYRQAKIDTLTAEIARLKRWQFGRRSEQMDPSQRALFEEVVAADIAAIETELESLRDPASPTPRRPKRQALPAHLPRIEHRHEPASSTCACGQALTPMGKDVAEQLDCEPVRFFVLKHIYPKYTCRACETIVFAYRTASPETAPITIFDFCTSRSGEHARCFLGDYRGALMVDEYAAHGCASVASAGCA